MFSFVGIKFFLLAYLFDFESILNFSMNSLSLGRKKRRRKGFLRQKLVNNLIGFKILKL